VSPQRDNAHASSPPPHREGEFNCTGRRRHHLGNAILVPRAEAVAFVVHVTDLAAARDANGRAAEHPTAILGKASDRYEVGVAASGTPGGN
jgi:hypothetical protein